MASSWFQDSLSANSCTWLLHTFVSFSWYENNSYFFVCDIATWINLMWPFSLSAGLWLNYEFLDYLGILEFLPEILPLNNLHHLSLANIRIMADENLRSVNCMLLMYTLIFVMWEEIDMSRSIGGWMSFNRRLEKEHQVNLVYYTASWNPWQFPYNLGL